MLKRILVVAALVAFPATLHAASFGPRLGFSADPDQVVFGAQLMFPEVADNLSFDPSAEIGLGDNLTLLSLNADFHYHFDISGSNWRPYAGAGATLSFISFDDDDDFPGNDDDTELEAGGGIILGAGVPTKGGDRFFGELKLGLGDVPDFKLMVGWNFGR